MDLKQAIESRASIRQFRPDAVPIADLRELIRLAGCAPSVNNAQPWRYIAVRGAPLKQSMAQAVRHKLEELLPEARGPEAERYEVLRHYCTFFETAPVVLAVATRSYEALLDQAVERVMHVRSHELRGHPDEASLGASIQTLLLAATASGYGACWMTGPLVARPELEALLQIEHPWRLGAMVALGRAAETPQQSEKLAVDAILTVKD
jgi:nitroreductase